MLIVLHEEVGPLPRYVLFSFGGYWTGEDWSRQKRYALLYHDLESAMADAQRLEGLRGLRQFWTHIVITIQENEDFDIQDIREYLEQHCRIEIADDGEDESPCNDILFDIEIDWESLGEI